MARGLQRTALFALCAGLGVHGAVAAVISTPADSITGLYIPGWAQNTGSVNNFFNISAVNLTGVSHIYYAFLWIRADYSVYDPFNSLHLLRELKTRWPTTKLLLSVGGGGFSTSTWSAAATTGLATFVNNLVAAMKAAGADGIDLDWEFPVASDRSAFTGLCAALRSRFDAEGSAASPPRHFWLTAATQSIVTAGSFDGYDLPALAQTVDLFNIMTYTMHDPCYWETHTAFHTAWADCTRALDFYMAQGVPRSQLVLGLAFYGHVYTLLDAAQYAHPAPSVESRDCSTMTTLVLGLAFYGHVYTLLDAAQYAHPAPSVESRDCSTMTTVSYRGVLRELSLYGGSVHLNATERSAYYVRGTRWIGFDVAESMQLKMRGARDYGVGGVMIWDASLDTADGGLLRVVAERQPPSVRPCGGGFMGTGVCADAAQCCSEQGYCGAGDAFCGPRCRGGPCIAYPSPPPRPPAPPPNCGSGVVGGGRCANAAECCSAAGWCGTGESWCGANCVGGPCWNAPRPPPPSPYSPPPPAPPPPPPVPFGCGEGEVGNGTCAIAGQCCSVFGYCGTSLDYCGYGCQGGPCLAAPPPPPGVSGPMCGGGVVGSGQCGFTGQCCSQPASPPPTGAGTCGGGNVGNGRCPIATQCCSAAGWCGVSTDHCYTFCVGGPCWFPPPAPNATAPPPPAPGTVPCGGGVVGNKQCIVPTQCCSSAGWCAISTDHCLSRVK
ncbi:hypothetical protein GPECTOR_45g93 [Gonium pectorale]|uniref:Chitinase n=1 Tax=Gonium pectorale TaxID=33097 RepID=A0A150G982_GONPE|nr:hypothetical protein GPECTOR_45g93 [Gonium pectorale]|eukprot:KXZ46323.1 hypothetical protein GPECTOR_45g93 [Gonium pectorale]